MAKDKKTYTDILVPANVSSTISGNLGAKPEWDDSKDSPFCTYSICVNVWSKETEKREPVWVNIRRYGKDGSRDYDNLGKGAKVVATGVLTASQADDTGKVSWWMYVHSVTYVTFGEKNDDEDGDDEQEEEKPKREERKPREERQNRSREESKGVDFAKRLKDKEPEKVAAGKDADSVDDVFD